MSLDAKILPLRYPATDKPPELTDVDHAISLHGGRTVALDATQSRLQASKNAPFPSLSERVEELTRENGQLRLEIRHYQDILGPMKGFVNNVKCLDRKLERGLLEFDEAQKELEESRLREMVD